MSMALKEKIDRDLKKRDISPKSIMGTIKNSLSGFKYYAMDGKSIIIYIFCAILEIVMGFVFHINGLEWILIICILGIILSTELINTAIEKACDAVTKEYNLLIKIAKDCGSAATFVTSTVAFILNIIIFYPKIIGLF